MEQKTLSPRIYLLLILFFGLAAYSNTLHAPFYLDDYPHILHNPNMLDLWNWVSLFNYNPTRFLSLLSFAINYKISGTSPFGYHLVNLALHLMNGLWIFGIARLLLITPALKERSPLPIPPDLIAFAASILFICHPLQTQAVTYIVQRSAALASFFYLATIWTYLQFRLQEQRLFYPLALGTAILGMFSKEITLTIPAALLLCEVLFFDQNKKSILLLSKRILPFVLITLAIPALYLLWYPSLFQNGGERTLLPTLMGNPSHGTYLLTQIDVLRTYLRLLVFPVRQTFDYDFPFSTGFFSPATFGSFVLLMAILITGIYLRRKQPLASFGILFFFLALSIESGILPLPDLIFEHRLYLAMAGFAFFTVSFLAKGLRSSALFTAAVIILALVLGTLTFRRNAVWANEMVFWQDQTQKAPFKGRGYFHLGQTYNKNHQYLLAADSFVKALHWKTPDQWEDIHFNNTGAAYAKAGEIAKAEYWYRKGLAVFPESGLLHTNLAVLKIKKGDLETAAAILEKAITLRPKTSIAFYELALVYALQKKYAEAIPLLKEAIRLDPFLRPAQELLSKLSELQKNKTDAGMDLFLYQALRGSSPQTVIADNRPVELVKEEGVPKAIETLEETLRSNSSDPLLRVQLGELYRRSGQEEAAIASFRKAIEIAPSSREGYDALALLYKEKGDDPKALAVLVEYLRYKEKHKSWFGN